MKLDLFSQYRSRENECRKHVEKDKKCWYEEPSVLEAVDDCELMLVMARSWRFFYKQQHCVEDTN